jgi:small subunit ribosomal protein S6
LTIFYTIAPLYCKALTLFLPENLDITQRYNMTKYEFMLIMDPSLTEEERTASLTELKELFEKNSVKIEKEDVWGDKKLAYKINKSDRGFYILFDLEFDGTLIKNLSTSINLNRSIWRYMFTKIEA